MRFDWSIDDKMVGIWLINTQWGKGCSTMSNSHVLEVEQVENFSIGVGRLKVESQQHETQLLDYRKSIAFVLRAQERSTKDTDHTMDLMRFIKEYYLCAKVT
jgi:hypothetical protein